MYLGLKGHQEDLPTMSSKKAKKNKMTKKTEYYNIICCYLLVKVHYVRNCCGFLKMFY